MARNKKLELNNVAPGRWVTSDGRFAVLKIAKPINPMLVTDQWKIAYEFSIRSFEGYDGLRGFPELAPEIGRVDVYRKVFPWLGQYTGEGSFDVGNPEQMEAKPLGGSRIKGLREMREELFLDVVGDLVD